MRESCSCGAAIHTYSYDRILTWRYNHLHTAEGATDLFSDTTAYPVGFTAEPLQDDEASVPTQDKN